MSESTEGIFGHVATAVRRFLPNYLFTLLVTPFLLTAGVFSQRHRSLIFQIARHFGLKLKNEEQRIPVVSLSEVLSQRLDVILLEPLAEVGHVTLLELLVISSLARSAAPPWAFEIGTFDGRTALNIAANLPPSGQLFTLDLPKSGLRQTEFALAPGESAFVKKEISGARFTGTVFADKITQLYGDSATFDFGRYEGKCGLLFIDGSHAFDYVRKDSTTAIRLASDEGVILWHDYQPDWPGVIRALNELFERNPEFRQMRRVEGTSLVMLRIENSGRST